MSPDFIKNIIKNGTLEDIQKIYQENPQELITYIDPSWKGNLFHEVIDTAKLDILKFLMTTAIDPCHKDKYEKSPFGYVVGKLFDPDYLIYIDFIKEFLEFFKEQSSEQCPHLLAYLCSRDIEELFIFVANGNYGFSDMSLYRNAMDDSLVELAIRNGKLNIAMFIAKKIGFDYLSDISKYAILPRCVEKNYLELTSMLLNSGADIFAKYDLGQKIIHYSSMNIEMISLLQSYGSDLDAVGDDGETLLFRAYRINNRKVIDFLIKDCGVDTSKKNNQGKTAEQCRYVYEYDEPRYV